MLAAAAGAEPIQPTRKLPIQNSHLSSIIIIILIKKKYFFVPNFALGVSNSCGSFAGYFQGWHRWAAPCAITAPPPPPEGPSSNKDTRDVWGGIGVE
jgi:hypothetical protein